MSSPKTNIEKEKRRHRPVLYWMLAVVLLGTVGAVIIVSSPVVPEDERDVPADAAGG
ncbi:MAG: hypothetical protein RIG84_00910 [Roseovarius sp.]